MRHEELTKLIQSISKSTSFTSAQIASMQGVIGAAELTKQRMARMMLSLNPKVLEIHSQFANTAQQMGRLAEQVRRSFVIPEFVQLHEHFKQRIRELDVFILILSELGWTPALDVSVTDISMWVNEFELGGLDAVREPLSVFLTELYDEEILLAMLAEWKQHPHLKPRMKILNAAVLAHIRGEFELSVPVLIAQVEGFFVAAKALRGRVTQKTYRQLMLETADDDKQVSSLIKSFVIKHLLEQFEHGDPIPELSRNAILHGSDIEYAKATNSLKIILLIDWLRRHFVNAA